MLNVRLFCVLYIVYLCSESWPYLTFVTPLNMFSTWLQTVCTAANSLRFPNHLTTLIFFFPSMEMSTARCLKVRERVPRGPFTITFLECTLASTKENNNEISSSVSKNKTFIRNRKLSKCSFHSIKQGYKCNWYNKKIVIIISMWLSKTL